MERGWRGFFSGLISVKFHFGRIVFVAWLTATFLHLRQGISVTLPSTVPVELIMRAGLLFGYYTFFMVVLFFIIVVPTFYFVRLIGFVARLTEVAAMFIAILFFSETLLHQLAPIGLIPNWVQW